MSAPASMNSSIVFKSQIGSFTPAPCILPAMINPEKCFLANSIAFTIALLVTPVPGLPVKQIKSNPNSCAACNVFSEH